MLSLHLEMTYLQQPFILLHLKTVSGACYKGIKAHPFKRSILCFFAEIVLLGYSIPKKGVSLNYR